MLLPATTISDATPQFRVMCQRCWKPQSTCYCVAVVPFTPAVRFVILIHPLEHRRGVASGRMAHLSLTNSLLLRGVNFTHDHRVNEILEDPTSHCVVLYPGQNAVNLSELALEQRRTSFPPEKNLTVFVYDGTWNTARKMRRLSTNLTALPMISFRPTEPSRFRIRKQPKENFYSTLEAIHHLLTLLEGGPGPHDQMLQTFDWMIRRQLHYMKNNGAFHPALVDFRSPGEKLPPGRRRHGESGTNSANPGK